MGETAGYMGDLVAGLRMLGVRADFLNLAENPFAYEARETPRLTFRLARWLALRNAGRGRPRQVWIAA